MARFRSTISNGRSDVSRLGHAKHGMTARVNGWSLGIRVDAGVTDADHDAFDVFVTGGSNARITERCVGRLTFNAKGEPQWTPTPERRTR